jgi:hypothetical protein
VRHEPASSAWRAVLTSVGPFLLNSSLAALFGFPAALKVLGVTGSSSLVDFIVLWLAVSIGMHAIPSIGDARSMWSQVFKVSGFSAAKVFVVPLPGIIYLLAFASFLWVDVIYGATVVMLAPLVFVQTLA